MSERDPSRLPVFVGITCFLLALVVLGGGGGGLTPVTVAGPPASAFAQVPFPPPLGDWTGPIPYSDFKRLVAQGRVADLTIDATTIRGTLKDRQDPKKPGGTFTTLRVDDPGLIRELQERGITFRAAPQPTWLRDLMTIWVLPLVPTITAFVMLTTRNRRMLSAIQALKFWLASGLLSRYSGPVMP